MLEAIAWPSPSINGLRCVIVRRVDTATIACANDNGFVIFDSDFAVPTPSGRNVLTIISNDTCWRQGASTTNPLDTELVPWKIQH